MKVEREKTVRIRVFGIVQGVGFRPTVKRHADYFSVSGSVCNRGSYVEILASGTPEAVDSFINAVKKEPPKRAVILKMDVEEMAVWDGEITVGDGKITVGNREIAGTGEEEKPIGETACGSKGTKEENIEKIEFEKTPFQIIESAREKGEIFVSPDIAICPECKRELYDKNNRRYLHPFINCTCCGPRLTILNAMPYDRERTSMAAFPMCAKCEYEYTHPETRRFDAQPVCCNECGPEVYLLGRKERGAAAIKMARKVIKDGGIVAVKGIGGFHLCCDATREETVARLRERKRRPRKPFAVMMKNMETVRRECDFEQAAKQAVRQGGGLSDGQIPKPFSGGQISRQASGVQPERAVEKQMEEILDGHQKPILLLPWKAGGRLCGSVAPDNPRVGVMLPYAPIQLLLFDYEDETEVSDCLVMTSANTSGAPICRDDADAAAELSGLCDVILSHNRNIRIRADDTVMDFYRGEPYMIRRSRGYAPLPFMVGGDFTGEVLAVGGELKNSFCIGKDSLFYPSPYIGDMGDVRTVRALKESAALMEELLEAKPSVVACDLHPSYNTVAAAEEMGLPVFRVQHHYAHILSCMAENDWTDRVIGVSFDGTGYGTDGTIWGGEILLCDYDGFTRWGAIDSFSQTGGDLSAKEGWRIAVSLLGKIYGTDEALPVIEALRLCEPRQAKLQFLMEEKGINTVTSTSAGRLFDAVSAILGIRRASTFEGEAATALQFAAERGKANLEKKEELRRIRASVQEKTKAVLPETECGAKQREMLSRGNFLEDGKIFCQGNFSVQREDGSGLNRLPTLALVKEITKRRLAGEEAENLSLFFHRALANLVVEACVRAREETGVNTISLSGGVYQNTLLLTYSVRGLEAEGFHVLTHHLLPPNDGGICLGQAVAAMRYISKIK